jgi:lipopolysaccharide/colanic/teichoic acid biosynthesis glycosyltransferase
MQPATFFIPDPRASRFLGSEPVFTEAHRESSLILFIGKNGWAICQDMVEAGYKGLAFDTPYKALVWMVNHVINEQKYPAAVVCDAEFSKHALKPLLRYIRHYQQWRIPVILLAEHAFPRQLDKIRKIGVDECFLLSDVSVYELNYQIDSIYDELCYAKQQANERRPWYKRVFQAKHNRAFIKKAQKVIKRLFDIVVSACALIVLSPLFLVIAVVIKLDSRGGVFYISERAGKNYKVFNFYKFRTMEQDADKKLQTLSQAHNLYGNTGSAFVKIQNDPRVTGVGQFLRDTSLDELPQLWNVLKGDMSLVGNRPLPLYEAEALTRDGDSERFLTAAGITGLWQVTKRGRGGDMSDRERIKLDCHYAKRESVLYDFVIMAKTFPALRQKESM